MLLPKDHTLF